MQQFIPLGTIQRPQRGFRVSPSEVASDQHLPERLLLGSLDRDDFAGDDEGWTATYQGSHPDTYTRLSFSRVNSVTSLRETWEGIPGPKTQFRADAWQPLFQSHASGGLTESWEQALADRLNSNFGCWYERGKDGRQRVMSVPDGYRKQLLVPVDFRQLEEVVEFVQALAGDHNIAAPVHSGLVLSTSYAHYLEGRNPAVDWSIQGFWEFTLRDLAMIPIEPPRVQEAPDGERAITIHRSHYTLAIECFFRDLEFVIHAPRRGELILQPGNSGSRIAMADRHPIVLDWSGEFGGLQLVSSDGGRQYEFTPIDLREHLSDTTTAEVSDAKVEVVRNAVATGKKLLDDLEV